MTYLEGVEKLVLGGATLSDDGETAGGSAFIVIVPDRAEGA